MGNCPAGTLNNEEEDPGEAEGRGWTSTNQNYVACQKTKVGELWPDGIVPYEIDHSLDFNRDRILKAMKTIEKYSRIRFVKRSYQKPFLKITRQDGCYFAYGDCDRPKISLGIGCESYATILHELLHALGFQHEQKRPDRDKYLIIHWENIKKSYVMSKIYANKTTSSRVLKVEIQHCINEIQPHLRKMIMENFESAHMPAKPWRPFALCVVSYITLSFILYDSIKI
ncbi:astacin-like metalloprotease toxin 5 isoform X1 [Argiope bruennichi]|uniref:astacin-like metalloprotease toxin 5 isoform X1 n=1 Tax=Argiope bruennichi TaxID=94029 RepID=UPI002494FDAE|nr:astacin-like metalloprotease toxin 5 isoform X1 [Argiope bruennichi]